MLVLEKINSICPSPILKDNQIVFFNTGKPHFGGPGNQITVTNNGACASASIRYINASDTCLRTKLQEHIDVLQNEKFKNINYAAQD